MSVPASLLSLCAYLYSFCWHITNMHVYPFIQCFVGQSVSTSLRMCQSLCVSVYISYPLSCLSVGFCVFGCVSDTALPLMSWVWRRDGFSGRRRVLVWERVNDQTWSKLPWLRHFLLSQLILKRNIANVLTLKWGIPHSEHHEITDARMCAELTKIVSVKRPCPLQLFSIVLQWEESDGGLMM